MWDRERHRESIIKLNGIRNASRPYHFFYDETNNIAKLRLKSGRLNVSDPQCFALGGVVTVHQPSIPNLSFFLSLLNLQPSVPELKREYLGKGEFLGVLDGERTHIFLEWLASQSYFLHYQIVDPLYWGMVDIIDSVVDDMQITAQVIVLSRGAKADLHRVFQHDLPETERVFTRFEYPNIKSKNLRHFFQALMKMVRASKALPIMNQKMLEGLLEIGSNKTDMPFLGGEEEATLLDSFDKFYAERIMLFENGTHIFDIETRIQGRIAGEAYQRMIGPQTSYTFADSKSDMGVQVSDLIIGIIGKYFSFLNAIESDNLLPTLVGLSQRQLDNLNSLKTLIDRSDAESNAFFHHVISAYLSEKHQRVFAYLG